MFFNRPKSNSLNEVPYSIGIEQDKNSCDTNNKQSVKFDDKWQTVTDKKRLRNSPQIIGRLKQAKVSEYWLSAPVTTNNRFDALSDTEHETVRQEKSIKPPPIFVDKVSNIQPLIKFLNDVVKDCYEIKILKGEQVKIQPKTIENYTTIVKELKLKNTKFHTYKPKQDRSYRIVLKNIHASTDIAELKQAIKEQGHTVTNIWNIKHNHTKKPLPIFYVELKPNSENKRIYNIKTLLHCHITFEPPRPKRKYLNELIVKDTDILKIFAIDRCIKCADNHHMAKCTRKIRFENVKCVLCDGNHPANYNGCSVYKQIQK